MSLVDEYNIRKLLSEAHFYAENVKENESYQALCNECIGKVHKTLSENVRSSFINISYETFIMFAETTIQIKGQEHLAKYYLDLFFQRNTSRGQMYIRALLCYARVIAHQGQESKLKAEENITNLQKALAYVTSAIEIIARPENKQKYAFLIYNASVCVYHIIRPMFRPDWQKHFTVIVEKLVKLLEEVDEPDHSWLCRFTWLLFHCVYDSDKKPDALKIFEKLWDLTKKKGDCDFQDNLFRLRIHLGKDSAALVNTVKKEAETAPIEKGWRQLVILQLIRSGLIPEAQVEKELTIMINTISPGILTGNDLSPGSTKRSPVTQERLAEAGRVALSFNLLNITEAISNYLNKVRQLSQKARIMLEYIKAEYLIKKPGPVVDPKTNMRLNSIQIKRQEIERRSEALRIMEKVMGTNKRVNDPELIYEGAIIIWNLSLPFLNANHKSIIYEPFVSASSLLEATQSSNVQLRVNYHLEIAKIEIEQGFLMKAEQNLNKALALDYSLAINKIKEKPDAEEDLSLYQRPFDRHLKLLKDRVTLKQSIYAVPDNYIENVIMELETAASSKSENMRMEVLQKCLGILVSNEEPEFYNDPAKEMVSEEVEAARVKHKQKNLYMYKQKKLLAGEVCKQAFDWELADIAIRAAEFVIADTWEPKNASEMILIQAECCYILALSYIDLLLKENFEIAFAEPTRINAEDQDNEEQEPLSPRKIDQVLTYKKDIVRYLIQGLKHAKSVGQSWLIFNGAIYIWNNYLPVFRNPSNDSKLLPEILNLLGEFFEAMKNYNKELEKKYIPDYDLDSKMLVYANIGIIYARLLEFKSQYDEVVKACEALLLSPLNPHTRKLINSIRARTSGMAKTTGKAQTVEKGKAQVNSNQNNDQLLFDVVSQLEIIQNNTVKAATPDLIKKCYETLTTWKAKENDETELELHAELWARLAKLALNEQTTEMYKYSLKSVEMSLSLLNANSDLSKIPVSRLRWYSLANYLYGETLSYMINPQTQEKESQERLLFYALKHSEEAAHKGCKADINILVLDAAKQFWNICSRLKDSAMNRKALIKPIFTMIYYLKTVKETSEPDLVLLLNRLITQAALENNEFELGESTTDMAFELIPKHLQRTLWESKMVFLSKQGKNELQAINNMKEADQALQARLWIKLARTSVNTNKQFVAYQKAIDIFRKEDSIEIVDVLIEFSEWLLRNGYEYRMVNDNLLEAANVLVDIEIEQRDDDDEDFGEDHARSNSIYSKSSRKLSSVSKSVKSRQTTKSTVSKQKKTTENKSTMSKGGAKSKISAAGSRLSRASLRGTTNMKTKVSKSFFAEREEEGNPEKLNVSHFDRLLRIHGMLAMLAKTNEEALQYSLNAKLFLLKIFELSYKTLNTMEQAAIKLSQMNKDDKTLKNPNANPEKPLEGEAPDIKFNLPQKPEEWINYQIPKEFIERIRTTENTNIMSKVTFEKAELTYSYLEHILKTFEGLGHHLHCLEIYSFMRFFVKEILNPTSQITTLIECKYSRFLFSLGLTAEGESIYKNLSFVKFFPNSIERKNLLTKVEASVVGYQPKATNDEDIPQDKKASKKSNLVKEIHLHQIWIDLAQEFISLGEINKATTLLDFAFDYARILNDIENLGFIEHLRSQIYYFEGKYSEALEASMRGHRYPKSLLHWRSNIKNTYKVLWKLEKDKDVDMMLTKVETVFSEMQNDKQYEANERELNHNLLMVYLIRCLNGSKCMLKVKSVEKNFQHIKDTFEKISTQVARSGVLVEHVEIFQNIIRKLNKFCETTPIIDDALVINYNVLEKVVEMTGLFESQMELILKHSVKTSVLNSPLFIINSYLKVLQAVSICNFGIVKNHIKYVKLHLKKAEKAEKASTSRNLAKASIERSKTTLHKKNLSTSVEAFLRKLTLKAEAENQLLKQRFDSYEKASSILSSIVNSFPNNSHYKIICKLSLAKVKRLLAYYNRQMTKVWGISKSPEQMVQESDDEEGNKNEGFDYKSDALKAIRDLLTGEQPKMIELFFIPEYSLDFGLMFSQEMIENFGFTNSDITFEYLSKYQNTLHLKWLKKIIKNAASPTHRFFILERLSKFSYTSLRTENQNLTNVVLNEFKLTDILYKNIDFPTIKNELLPNNSAYLILQMPPNELFLYIGFMHINQNREFKYSVQKYYFKEKDQYEIKDLIENINSMKSELQRTPHTTLKDLADLEAKYTTKSKEVLTRLEELCGFFTKNLDKLINPIIEEPAEPQPPVDPKAKPGAAAPAKDAGKDKKKPVAGEVQAYVSGLSTPTSGIESLILLVDERLSALPWEGLQIFQKIPVLSRDFSLNIYAKRLRNVGFKPELNNSQGIAKEKLKYVVYEFKAPPEAASQNNSNASATEAANQSLDRGSQAVVTPDIKVPEIQPLFKEIVKSNPTLKVEGVASSDRIPSLGEWENYLRDGSMLFYFGNSSILNIITPRILVDLVDVANVKGFVVIDRINSRKSTIDKFEALEPNPEKVFMHEQPLQTLGLLTALGLSFIMMNHWPVRPDENLKALDSFLKSSSEGNYLGRGLVPYKEPEIVFVDSEGKVVKKEEEKEDPKAPKKDDKKAGKKDIKKLPSEVPKVGQEAGENGNQVPELKEVVINKPPLHQDGFIFYGVPLVRFT